jgi:hypothetical protein
MARPRATFFDNDAARIARLRLTPKIDLHHALVGAHLVD